MEGRRFTLPHFFTVQSDDPRIVRQSRLLQILVGLTTLAALRGGLQSVSRLQSTESSAASYIMFVTLVIATLVFAFITFSLLHRGRFLAAVHIFFITLNAILISLLFSIENVFVFPYLLLISVVSIAALQSVRASALYLVVIAVVVSLYFVNLHPEGVAKAVEFVSVALFLAAPSWFFANDLRNSRDRADILTRELEKSVGGYSRQTRQLQHIAEIGRMATASLDRDKLLSNTVELIQDRFGFYNVTILLLSPDGRRLVVEEVSGESGRKFVEQGHHLTIGELSLAGWVALNRQARIALDVGEDPYYFNDPNLPDTRSEVALPLIARGRLLGVLDVHSRESNAFQEEDVSALQVMADQVANGLDNARLFEEISNQAALLTELQTITNLMSQQANTRNALNVIAQRAIKLFNADGGGIFLYSPAENNLKFVVNLDVSEKRVGETLEPGQGLAGRAFADNKTLAVEDYNTWEGRAENFSQGDFHAAAAIPLRRQNEPFGVMTLSRSQEGQPFKQDEIQVAELLAAQISAVITNNQLIEETRRLVQRERSINQASAQIRRSLDAKTILDTMTDELGHLLGNKVVKARLYPQKESGAEENELI